MWGQKATLCSAWPFINALCVSAEQMDKQGSPDPLSHKSSGFGLCPRHRDRRGRVGGFRA